MKTVIVVAISANGIIGREGRLPWRCPADLRHFRQLTWGHPVVMGRKTFEAIGKPLPGRPNLVLTRNPSYQVPDGVLIFPGLASARDYCATIQAEKIFVIGGAEIYRLALPEADEMVVTRIPEEVAGDTPFPPWDPLAWEVIDSKEAEGLRFITYRRKS